MEARVPKTAQPMVGAAVRTIFQQDSCSAARAQLKTVCETLREKFPSVVQLIAAAEEGLRLPRWKWKREPASG